MKESIKEKIKELQKLMPLYELKDSIYRCKFCDCFPDQICKHKEQINKLSKEISEELKKGE